MRRKLFIYLNCLLLVFFIGNFCFAVSPINDDLKGEMGTINQAFVGQAGYNQAAMGNSITNIMSLVIKAFLSLLGIMFLVIIINAGYKWMTAGGEEEKIRKAKDEIQRAVIGLIITIGAYAITFFVFNVIGDGGSSNSPFNN